MKKIIAVLGIIAVIITVLALTAIPAFAEGETEVANETVAEATVEENTDATVKSSKAMWAAIVVCGAAIAAAIAMGLAIAKTSESIARQPEAEGSIRSTMMLGLVFIETLVIYALVVAILIVFVL